MSDLNTLYSRLMEAMGVAGLEIPLTAVKFYKTDDEVPAQVLECRPYEQSITSCQAARQAALGEAICLTRDDMGCIAAAISLGLVDQNEARPLREPRVYTGIMREQWEGKDFRAPSPKEFTDGIVYACRDAGRDDYCLFGKDDSGRFRDVETARRAVSEMIAIQPPIMRCVFFYSHDFARPQIVPDVVVLSVRPVELARIVQAYSYYTGKRLIANMGAVRVVCSDLIVRPYLTGKPNASTYCVGARLMAAYQADRLGIGMPYTVFRDIVEWMEMSKTGYPFHLYPGADPRQGPLTTRRA